MASEEESENDRLRDVYDGDEAAIARFRDAERRLRETPPRCLAGFEVEPTELAGVVLDGHGSGLNKAYRLSCACGHDQFHALGHRLKSNQGGGDLFVSPLALECAGYGTVTELIDTDRHGYDAELGHGSVTLRGRGRRSHFACDRCGTCPMAAYARFEHSGEELADSFVTEFPNAQDYFSWFSLIGNCDGCGRLLNVADFECA